MSRYPCQHLLDALTACRLRHAPTFEENQSAISTINQASYEQHLVAEPYILPKPPIDGYDFMLESIERGGEAFLDGVVSWEYFLREVERIRDQLKAYLLEDVERGILPWSAIFQGSADIDRWAETVSVYYETKMLPEPPYGFIWVRTGVGQYFGGRFIHNYELLDTIYTIGGGAPGA